MSSGAISARGLTVDHPLRRLVVNSVQFRGGSEMAVEDEIQFERDGDVARVWLNRPHKKNAVTVPILHRLDEIIIEVDERPRAAGPGPARPRQHLLLGLRPRRAARRLRRQHQRHGGRGPLRQGVRPALLDEHPFGGGARGLRHRRRLRADDLLRLRGRRRRRQDRRLPHPPRAVRRRGPDLPAAAHDRHPQDQGADAHRQAAVRQGGRRLRPDQRLRAGRGARPARRGLHRARSSTRARSRCG